MKDMSKTQTWYVRHGSGITLEPVDVTRFTEKSIWTLRQFWDDDPPTEERHSRHDSLDTYFQTEEEGRQAIAEDLELIISKHEMNLSRAREILEEFKKLDCSNTVLREKRKPLSRVKHGNLEL
jgi:hypothetical protein